MAITSFSSKKVWICVYYQKKTKTKTNPPPKNHKTKPPPPKKNPTKTCWKQLAAKLKVRRWYCSNKKWQKIAKTFLTLCAFPQTSPAHFKLKLASRCSQQWLDNVQWWQQPLDITNSWEVLPSHYQHRTIQKRACKWAHVSTLVTTLDIMSQVEILVLAKL